MNKIILFFILILLLPTIIAECSENQIDINSASLDELDKLNGIGPAKADAIINARPFYSIDDLIKVYGIGEVTLSKIKEQGLACVEDEVNNEEDKKEQNKSNSIELEENKEDEQINNTKEGNKEEIQIIKLTAKSIKTNDNFKNKTNYKTYSIIGFCILLIALYLIKHSKKNGLR